MLYFRKRFTQKFDKIKHHKVRDLCHYEGKYKDAAHSIRNRILNASNEILVIFHNGSNYDYSFIIKKLANNFKYQF